LHANAALPMLALRWRAVVRLMKRAAAAAYAQARLAALHRTVNQRHRVKACKALMSQQRTWDRSIANSPTYQQTARTFMNGHLRLPTCAWFPG